MCKVQLRHAKAALSSVVDDAVVSVLVFGLIGRFGDLPKLLGAWNAKE